MTAMDTKRLTERDIPEAASIIATGGLLGIPTETVYGLGANGLDPTAVAAIFAAKGRPQDNPLILHIPSAHWLERYCEDIPAVAYTLARRFWPGPLTMILKRKALVPDAVTAGLDTVGMRCPDCALTRTVIATTDVPVAAPSGNTSGRPSPTTAEAMLEDMDGKIHAIMNGGPCRVGVESTIVDLTLSPPRLLRPGGVTLEDLESVLGKVAVDEAVVRIMSTDEKPRAPGMKYRHYAPKAPITVVRGELDATAHYIKEHLSEGDGVICFYDYVNLFGEHEVKSGDHLVQTLGQKDDPSAHAQRIFEALRAFDHVEVKRIWAQSPESSGLGLAVTNRLNKAAGFHIIEL